MANTQNLDLVKPLGTDHALVSVLNSNSDKIDAYAGAVNAGLDGLRDGLGILADGNTHAAVTSGQFVYVKNHQTLPEGLYQATTNIAANGTLSTSNLAADPKGGLNTLSEQIGNKTSTESGVLTSASSDVTIAYAAVFRFGKIVTINSELNISSPIAGSGYAVANVPQSFIPNGSRTIFGYGSYNNTKQMIAFYVSNNGSIYTSHGGQTITGYVQLFGTYVI